jgi:hypothetical protein
MGELKKFEGERNKPLAWEEYHCGGRRVGPCGSRKVMKTTKCSTCSLKKERNIIQYGRSRISIGVYTQGMKAFKKLPDITK